MKIFIVYLCIICCCACSSTVDSITRSTSQKNTAIEGFASFQKVQFSTDQTPAEALSAIGRISMNTTRVAIADSEKTPNYAHVKVSTTSSIWNSNAIDTTGEFTITASDSESAYTLSTRCAEAIIGTALDSTRK